MSIELKIKAKHLALEPAIIRKEERKLLKQLAWVKQYYQVYYVEDHSESLKLYQKWNSLQCHRRWNVRNEARATELARAYMAGIPYVSVEKKRKPENELTFRTRIIPRVTAMVLKYGSNKNVTDKDIEMWSTLS